MSVYPNNQYILTAAEARAIGNIPASITGGDVYTIQYNNGTYTATGLVISNS